MILGLFGLLAATLFVILVSDSPQHNRFISTHELRYLDIMLHDQGVKIRTVSACGIEVVL